MTHVQNTTKTVPVQPESCPESSPLAVLGTGDPIVTARAFNWPDTLDNPDDDFDAITIDNGRISFSDDVEPAPKLSRSVKITVGVVLTITVAAFIASMIALGQLGGVA
ncbi:hypothetical protein ABH922_002760 [Rhodococcus sp. 27YEA15]|uniref:hypothetical protein n=1 Tax=Rhodococcus sp. 27YEA15 TaxID=3156259 RepID=UPI003C79944F